ncbi:MAG: NRDE family protein [Acetobacterales bacterium]
MCTVVILRRPDHPWPLILGANRDEMRDRPWDRPGRHWTDRPDVVAGLDRLAGGSWLGLNDSGVVATILNRTGSLGPDPDRRSRGELVLEALDHADAGEAVRALSHLRADAYRSFNMLIADDRDAWWLRSLGYGRVEAFEVPPGVSMLTSQDLNDPRSPRIKGYKPRFEAAPAPDPEADDWFAWEALMAGRVFDTDAGPRGAMAIDTETGFGTVSSTLIAMPDRGQAAARPVWRFAAGMPGKSPYERLDLGAATSPAS